MLSTCFDRYCTCETAPGDPEHECAPTEKMLELSSNPLSLQKTTDEESCANRHLVGFRPRWHASADHAGESVGICAHIVAQSNASGFRIVSRKVKGFEIQMLYVRVNNCHSDSRFASMGRQCHWAICVKGTSASQGRQHH